MGLDFAAREMGTGISLAKDRIRSSQSPVNVHSGTLSTGASQLQVTTEDGRGLLWLGSADIPSGSAAAGQSLPYGQTSSRSTSTQPSLPSRGSSSSENEMEEGRNLPTPPLVRTTRGACAERFDVLSRKFWSGENFGPGDQNSRKIGPPGPLFPENVGPAVE